MAEELESLNCLVMESSAREMIKQLILGSPRIEDESKVIKNLIRLDKQNKLDAPWIMCLWKEYVSYQESCHKLRFDNWYATFDYRLIPIDAHVHYQLLYESKLEFRPEALKKAIACYRRLAVYGFLNDNIARISNRWYTEMDQELLSNWEDAGWIKRLSDNYCRFTYQHLYR